MAGRNDSSKAGAQKAGARARPKAKNPGASVVNVYGSGPLPVGERPARTAKRAGKPKPGKSGQGKRGALSTSLEGKDRQS